MNWNLLTDPALLDEIDRISNEKPVVIFKHSTRCNISAGALDRIERNFKEQDGEKFVWYYLDLLKHRDISNAIVQRYGVPHESPQVLIIREGKSVYYANHFDIRYEDVVTH